MILTKFLMLLCKWNKDKEQEICIWLCNKQKKLYSIHSSGEEYYAAANNKITSRNKNPGCSKTQPAGRCVLTARVPIVQAQTYENAICSKAGIQYTSCVKTDTQLSHSRDATTTERCCTLSPFTHTQTLPLGLSFSNSRHTLPPAAQSPHGKVVMAIMSTYIFSKRPKIHQKMGRHRQVGGIHNFMVNYNWIDEELIAGKCDQWRRRCVYVARLAITFQWTCGGTIRVLSFAFGW